MLSWEEVGSGPLVLLLPALSSISTRGEMRPLMQRLGSQYRLISIDWPGFGTLPRPAAHWTPNALSAFLEELLRQLGRPHAIVAAGHAASYVLRHAADHRGCVDRLILVAPTWRGPLPTMAGGYRPFFEKVCRAVEMRGIGPLLYRLNVNPLVVGRMVAGHVYSNVGWLSGSRLAEKRQVMNAPGARFASAAFVTGSLDLMRSRTEFLALAEQVAIPIMLIYGAETPARSRAEMEALASLPAVTSERLMRGKLSVHEEFPDEVGPVVRRFLKT